MADEPKPNSGPDESGLQPDSSTNMSPAPAEVVETPPATPASPADQTITDEPLIDGTVPTVLSAGRAKVTVNKKSTALTSVYRRADIITTLATFIGTILATVLIFGAYMFLTRDKTPIAPKVSTLDKADLSQLEAFFGGNAAGKTPETLTVSATTLFKNRVAFGSDLKVIGGVQVSGPTALGDLTVDKTTTLGTTHVRGQMTIAGPLTLQSPTTINGGLSVNGGVTASGNASFGGSLSAGSLNIRDITVSGALNLSGHLNVGGQAASATPGSEAGTNASANVDGNDAAGTVTVNTGNIPSHVLNTGGLLVTVKFRAPYPRVPRVIISPTGQSAGALPYYVIKTVNGFTIGATTYATSNTAYSWDYWVVQ